MKICVTGKYEKMTRGEIQDAIGKKGHTLVKAISKGTDILLCEDPKSGSVKLKQATELGIKVISYEEYFKA